MSNIRPQQLNLNDFQNIIDWGTGGSDSDDGKNPSKRFATMNAARLAAIALSPSPTNKVLMRCLDAGTYVEDVFQSMPEHTVLECPFATLDTAISVHTGGAAYIGSLIPKNTTLADGVVLQSNPSASDTDIPIVIYDLLDTTQWRTPTLDNAGILNDTSNVVLNIKCNNLKVGLNCEGIGDTTGHAAKYIIDIDNLILAGNNAKGIAIYGSGGQVKGNIKRIIQESGTGTVGLYASTSGRIDVFINENSALTPEQVVSNGIINAISPTFTEAVQSYYVDKSGVDTNSGKSVEAPLLTMTSGLTKIDLRFPSASNRFVLNGLDAGNYTEGVLSISEYVDIEAPNAKLDARFSLEDNQKVVVGTVIPTFVNSYNCIDKEGATGGKNTYFEAKLVDLRSGNSTAYGVVTQNDTELDVLIHEFYAVDIGYAGYSSMAGTINIHGGKVFLSTNAIAVGVSYSASLIQGKLDIDIVSGATGTKGISCNSGTVRLNGNYITAATAIEVLAGTVYADYDVVTGNITVSAGAVLYANIDNFTGTITNAGTIIGKIGDTYYQPIKLISKTGDFTIAYADINGKYIINKATAVTVTIPQTSTQAIPAGASWFIENIGVGDVTLVKEGSDVLRGNTLIAQYATAKITKDIAGSPNTYVIEGGTAVETLPDLKLDVETVANKDKCISMPSYSGKAISIKCWCRSGSCDIAASIDGTPMTHDLLSTNTTTKVTKAITGNNDFTNSSTILITMSNNAACLDLTVMIECSGRVQ